MPQHRERIGLDFDGKQPVAAADIRDGAHMSRAAVRAAITQRRLEHLAANATKRLRVEQIADAALADLQDAVVVEHDRPG